MSNKSSSRSWLLTALIIVATVLAVYYFFLPLLGFTVVFTTGAFAFVMGILALLFLFILLIPILVGAAFFIMGLVLCLAFMIAFILFPVLLPILIPVIVLLLLIKLITWNRGN